MAEVQFPAYRTHEQMRAKANDAAMALIVGVHLAELSLEPAHDDEMLTEVFPGELELRRLNLEQRQVRQVFADSGTHLACMAIPFVLSIHGAFVSAVIRMLQRHGVDASGQDPSGIRLSELHEHLQTSTGQLSPELLALFHFARQIRNRIIHNGATCGQLKSSWRRLPRRARESWTRLSDREPPLGKSDDRMAIGAEELVAVLAITHNLAVDVNERLQSTMSKAAWADTVVSDYASVSPLRARDRNTRARRIKGHARQFYGPLNLVAADLAGAIERWDERERG